MSTLISTRRIILAAGLALALPAHAVDWNEMLRGVLGKPAGQPSAARHLPAASMRSPTPTSTPG